MEFIYGAAAVMTTLLGVETLLHQMKKEMRAWFRDEIRLFCPQCPYRKNGNDTTGKT